VQVQGEEQPERHERQPQAGLDAEQGADGHRHDRDRRQARKRRQDHPHPAPKLPGHEASLVFAARREPVTQPPDSLHEALRADRRQRLAQPQDVHVDVRSSMKT